MSDVLSDAGPIVLHGVRVVQGPTQKGGPNMTKRDTLVSLLVNYRAAESGGSGGGPVMGDGVPLMPQTWTASYRELERCLHIMSSEAPKQTRQLLARYVDPTVSRRRLIGQRLKDGSVRFVNVPHHCEVRSYAQLPDRGHANEWTCLVASWPAWVRASLVDAALSKLEKLFTGEPFMPSEFLEDVAA